VYPRRDPKETTWYKNYVKNNGGVFLFALKFEFSFLNTVYEGTFSDVSHRDHGLFRLRFRVPYSKYKEMVDECKNVGWWQEMLMLGSLRLLARGWVLDDLYENTNISPNVHRAFFKKFVTFYSTVKRDEWIKPDAGDIYF
jgi:hypothetical protein